MNFVNSLSFPWKQSAILKRMQSIASSGKYSEGDEVGELNSRISMLYDQHAVVTSNAGAGLFALASCLGESLKIAVQNNTFVASGSMFEERGHSVYLVDSGENCPSMSADSLKKLLKREHMDVVVLTHVGGWMARDYKEIASLCNEHDVDLIEDCAHVFGLGVPEREGLYPGKLGLASVFSFYPTKNVPMGEGGAVISHSIQLRDAVRRFCNYGKENTYGFIEYKRGFNLRMDEWTAAVGNVQLENLHKIKAARERDAAKLSRIIPPMYERPSTYYKYIIPAQKGVKQTGKVYSRTDLMSQALGDSRCHTYVPLDNSRQWAESHMCLPIGEGMYDLMSVEEVAKELGIQ